jgi:hypothetical protein
MGARKSYKLRLAEHHTVVEAKGIELDENAKIGKMNWS